MQRDSHPLPTHKHTQHEVGGPNIRTITSKCLSGSKASVSFPNDSFLPLHRSLYFMVARASVAQAGLSSVERSPKNNCRSLNIHQFIVGSAKKCIGDCTLLFEQLEKHRPKSPSPWTNSDLPTEIVYWWKLKLCNLYYFIPRFSGVAIFFTHVCPFVPEYVSME